MPTYFKTVIIERLLQYLQENVPNKGVKFAIFLKILEKLMKMLIAQRSRSRSLIFAIAIVLRSLDQMAIADHDLDRDKMIVINDRMIADHSCLVYSIEVGRSKMECSSVESPFLTKCKMLMKLTIFHKLQWPRPYFPKFNFDSVFLSGTKHIQSSMSTKEKQPWRF